MKARVSEPLAASPFSYGPPDRRRRKAGRPQSHLPSPQPERQPQPAQAWASSAVQGTTYAGSVEVGIPSGEPGSYRGHLARDIRATVEASRKGRPPREGGKTMKGTTRTFLIVLAMATILATVTTGAAVAGKCGHGNNPHCSGSGGGGGSSGSYTVTITPAGPYLFGEQIYVTTDAPIYPNNTGPWIWLRCYQNGVLVASGDHAGFPDGWYYNWPFNLGPTQSWTGGAADCTVAVVHTNNNKVVTDATTSFHVDA